MTLSPPKATGIALRLLIVLPILLWAAGQWGRDYANNFLPLYRAVLTAMLNGFDVKPLEIIRGHEYLIKADYKLPEMMVVGGKVLTPGLEGTTHAPLYYTLYHPLILATALLIWPSLNWRNRFVRLLLSLPVLLALEALDIPLVLYSAAHSAVIQTYDPRGYLLSKPMDWAKFLEGGGRIALSMAGVFIAAELHRMLDRLVYGHPNRRTVDILPVC